MFSISSKYAATCVRLLCPSATISALISYMGAMGLLMGVASVNREREKQQRERAEWLEVIRE